MARERSPVDDTKLKAEGDRAPFSGPEPGSTLREDRTDIHIEGLGYLKDFATSEQLDNSDEGIGPWMVTLWEFVSGADDTGAFIRGDVRRLSKFVPIYGNPDVPIERQQAAVHRLLSLEAIRFADSEEQGVQRLELKDENETPQVRAEKLRRQRAEQELALMKEFVNRIKSGESVEDIEKGRVAAVSEEAPAPPPAQQPVTPPATTGITDEDDEDFGR